MCDSLHSLLLKHSFFQAEGIFYLQSCLPFKSYLKLWLSSVSSDFIYGSACSLSYTPFHTPLIDIFFFIGTSSFSLQPLCVHVFFVFSFNLLEPWSLSYIVLLDTHLLHSLINWWASKQCLFPFIHHPWRLIFYSTYTAIFIIAFGHFYDFLNFYHLTHHPTHRHS